MPHKELYIDGVWYPSVTTITASKPTPWLDTWREKWGVLAKRKTKIASAMGTEFHRCVEQWLKTGKYAVYAPVADDIEMPSLIPRVLGMMDSWKKWAMDFDGMIEHTEMQVASRIHIYSGTLDAIGMLKGKPVVLDWKTSSRIYDDMEMQLAAYAQAYNEQTGKKVMNGLIVCVSKDKPQFKLTTKQFRLGKRAFNKFLKLREAFDAETSVNETSGR